MGKKHSFSFLVILCTLGQRTVLASCEQDAVGVAGYILDRQLTASSQLNPSTPAKNGRLNFTAGPSWCASTSDASPYLQVDLQSLYIICAVSTQGNSQGSQWVEKYTLKVSTDDQTWRDYKENGKIKTFNGNFNENSSEKQNLFSGIVARYLRFVVVAKHGEACLRVEVFGAPRRKVHSNIAVFKPTSQSSTYSNQYSSSNAVDGDKSANVAKCTLTKSETNPWWRVDLGRVEPVAEVNIVNRDAHADRLNGAEIRVGNGATKGGANNRLCANISQILAGKSKTFICNPKAYGRYVHIRIPGAGKVLKLCEVEVYSYLLPTNLALNQSAVQINTAWGGVASRAVDGNVNTDYFKHSCTHTPCVNDPWWRVDLGSAFSVAEVVIVNRACTDLCGKRLQGFEIRIGNSTQNGGVTNPSCGGTHNMTSGETKAFVCTSSPVGQFVSVRIPGQNKYLMLCEVQVYSTKDDRDSVKGCARDPVGVSDSSVIPDQRFSASSSRGGSSPTHGRMKGGNAWIPATNSDDNDYLQIDLGSVYFVCGVETQGSPNNSGWIITYKIQTSLDNVNWNPYTKNGSVKIFTGNDDRSSIVRSELYEPLAAKFIRFFPILFNKNKALRVEIYGSRQGCLVSLKNERLRGFTQNLVITASSQSTGHEASSSLLYGAASWCSSSVSPPQYLQVDFRQIITLAGVATQGDATSDKWVTSYSISYGYDNKTWISYGAGKMFTGNSDRDTVIVHWFAPTFAAQYVRIVSRTYNSAMCMRMDWFGCKDFHVSSPLNINLDDVRLMANPGESVNVTCVASYSPRRPSTYEWYKDGAKEAETRGSLTISYSSAIDIYTNSCAKKLRSAREVQCYSTYQCAASLSGIEDKHSTTANVLVTLKKPSQPVVQVPSGDIKARSTTVTWSYSLGVDEMPITAYNLEYQNKTSKQIISLGNIARKKLINLKPYTSYSVKLMANSLLGSGLWSNLTNFTTKTDYPEVIVPVAKLTSLTSQSVRVEWQVKVNFFTRK